MRSQVPCHGPPPLLSQGLFFTAVDFQSSPKETALSMPCGQDAWQRQRKAQLCRFPWELGKLVELGPPSPGDIRRGWGEAGLPNCLLPSGHVVCSPLTGRHPQSLIQAAGIFPAAQRSSVLFPSSFYTCTCVCVCVGGECAGVCMCAFIHMEARGQPQGSSPGMSVTPWRQSFSPISACWLVELSSWIRLDSLVSASLALGSQAFTSVPAFYVGTRD